MTNRGPNGQCHCVVVERSAGRRSSDASTAALTGVPGDRTRPLRRAAGEQPSDGCGEVVLELDVLLEASFLVALGAAGANLGVGETLLLSQLRARSPRPGCLGARGACGSC